MNSLPPVAVVLHGRDNLPETSNVAASNEGWKNALGGSHVLGSSSDSVLEAILHDTLEAGIDLSAGPGDTSGVLSHFEAGDSDTSSIGGLSRSIPAGGSALVGLTVGFEDIDSGLSASHVGSLGNELASGGNQSLGFLARNLVLGGRRESDINLADVEPGAGALNVAELLAESLGVDDRRQLLALGLEFGNGVDLLGGEAALAVDDERALAVREGDDRATELDDLESFVLGDVAGARDGDTLASEGFLSVGNVLDHVLNIVDNTVASGLRADQATTPAVTLASENTLPRVADSLVLAEEVTNLETGDTNITSGNISVGTDVLAQLGHERNAEATDLVVRLALGVEVRTTLATTHVETGQSILEDLLETQELEDGQVHGGVETKTTLVRAKGGVELNTVALVDLNLALIVFPNDTELNNALGDSDNSESLTVLRVLLEKSGVFQG